MSFRKITKYFTRSWEEEFYYLMVAVLCVFSNEFIFKNVILIFWRKGESKFSESMNFY